MIGVGAAVAQSFSSSENVIHKGITVDGVKVGGLTRGEASEVLEQKIDNIHPISLTYKTKSWTEKPRSLGVQIDIQRTVEDAYQSTRRDGLFKRVRENLKTETGITKPVKTEINQNRLSTFLTGISHQIARPPQNPRVWATDNSLNISSEKPGIMLDREKTKDKIISSISTKSRTAELQVQKIEPEFTKEELKGLKPAGAFTTNVRHEDTNRFHNIKVATNLINGTILKPNEVFSFNSVANNEKTQKLYKVGTVLVNQAPKKAVGGGICQVSSTLYNAALQSGLKVVERRHHSIPVDDGVPLGRDAAVSRGTEDLKFKNNNSISVVTGKFVGDRITFKIFSQKPPTGEIIIKTEKEKLKPPPPMITNNPNLPEGEIIRKREARIGFKVVTKRETKAPSGEITKQKVSEDLFPPQGTLIIVGTKETNPEVLKIMVRK